MARRTSRARGVLGAAVLAAGLTVLPSTTGTLPAAGAAGARVTDGCISSVPDPGTTERVQICYTLFRPASASTARRVPLIMHSHGWGGSRTQDPASFQRFLDAGYGVLSYDQRGFGESGGQAYVENPRVEGRDVRGLDPARRGPEGVKRDGPGDPRLGAIGGSYGGGFQYLGAFESLRVRGTPGLRRARPRDHLERPQPAAWLPRGVVRAEWALALSGAAVPSDSLPPRRSTRRSSRAPRPAEWPDGSLPGGENLVTVLREERSEVARRPRPTARHPRADRPRHHRLAVQPPAGPDQLAHRPDQEGPPHQHLRRLQRRPRAALRPSPPASRAAATPAAPSWRAGASTQLSLRFFDEQLRGRDTGLRGYGRFHLATPDNTCTSVSSVAPDTTRALGSITTTTVAGPAQATEIAGGPYRIAGSAHLTAKVTTLTPNSRASSASPSGPHRPTPDWSRRTSCR